MNLWEISYWNAQSVCDSRKALGCFFCNMYDVSTSCCKKKEYLEKLSAAIHGSD